MKILFTLFSVLFACTVSAAADWKTFANLPMVEQPRVSPDGKQIATLYNSADGPAVAVAPFASMDFSIVAKLKKNRDRLDFIRWSGNRFLIIGTSFPEFAAGQYFRVQRLYSVDLQENTSQLLTSRAFKRYRWYEYQTFRLLSALRDDETHALVSTFDERDNAMAVFRVDLRNSDFEKVQANREEIDYWYADTKGVVRVGVQVEKEGSNTLKHIWYRDKAEGELKKIHTQILGQDDTFNILGLANDGTKVYVLSDRETRFESLWLYNVVNGEFEKKIFQAEGFDINDALTNSQGEIIGVEYFDDFYRAHYFDEANGKRERELGQLLKGKEVTIASQSEDKKRILVLASSDDAVPVYYWFDLNTNKGGAWLASYPYLANRKFSKVENISFEASDGMNITGYLTMPHGVEKPKLVVMPHGGPHARDYKYFDPLVQYVASLGYAVLQVNFRGSSGFGSDFEVAGYYEYGKRMQKDVYNGMDWLINTGRVDGDKACVVGASYGGYWALTASFQQPDRFDCVVSISGISDLQDLVSDRERRDYFSGNVVRDDDEDTLSKEIAGLSEVSAINHVSEIKAPILLIHGDNDTRVPYSQSADFYNKAKKHTVVKYIEIKDGTHFFDDAESKQTMYREVGEFLQKHL